MTDDANRNGAAQAGSPTILDQIRAIDSTVQLLRSAAAEPAKGKKKSTVQLNGSPDIPGLEAASESLQRLNARTPARGEPTKPGWFWARRRGIAYWRPTCVIERNGAL